jgi:hypothetical protein
MFERGANGSAISLLLISEKKILYTVYRKLIMEPGFFWQYLESVNR